ncbi:MAG: hypothetical protein EOO78_15650, partial [Oxalobacteraceae bacterium]
MPTPQRLLSFLVLSAALGGAAAHAADTNLRERIAFNADWRFSKGDPAGSPRQPAEADLRNGLPAAQAGFDDAGWRKLNLPHDWGIE